MKTRGVSTTKRLRKDGSISWDVRWRERIDGKMSQITKSFRDLMIARQFERDTDDRLEIVRRGRSLMHDHMLAPRPLSLAIPEFVAEKRVTCKKGSKYPDECLWFLTKGVKAHGWTHTSSINESALSLLKLDYARSPFSIYRGISLWQIFLRWAAVRYAVHASFEKVRVKQPYSKKSYAWTEAERERILIALKKPLPADYHLTMQQNSAAYVRKMQAYSAWRLGETLYPMIWLMAHWAPRPREMCDLDVGDFNTITNRLSLRLTKNGRPRSFIVDYATAALLAPLTTGRPPDEPLFQSVRGGRCHVGFISCKIKEILKELHISGTLYSARHHACTLLCRLLKSDLPAVQEITGHLEVSQLNKYLHNINPPDHAARAWDTQRQFIDDTMPHDPRWCQAVLIEAGTDARMPKVSHLALPEGMKRIGYRPIMDVDSSPPAQADGTHDS